MFCVKCGEPNNDDNNFCVKCGAKLYNPNDTDQIQEASVEILQRSPGNCKITIVRALGRTLRDKPIYILFDDKAKYVLDVGEVIYLDVLSQTHTLEFKLDYFIARINLNSIKSSDLKVIIWTDGSTRSDWLSLKIEDEKGLVFDNTSQIVPSNIGTALDVREANVVSDLELAARMQLEMERKRFEMERAQLKLQQTQFDSMAKCPHCGSTSLSGNKKGFGVGKAVVGAYLAGPLGLVAGNLGSKKVLITCLKCGKKFKA